MKNILSLIVIFILIMSAVTYVEVAEYNKRTSILITNEEELTDITYKTVVDAYEKNAKILFSTVITNKNILEIFHKAAITKDEIILDTYRKQLYSALIDNYNALKPYDIKQLHFHLKNNDSFLRFHRPSKYGDNLTRARKTVAFVNREHQPISGFEEGKIFNGYRFVFPLEYEGEHIGSVEISISMNAIINAIRHNLKSNINFIIDKKIVSAKVFKSEKSNYIPSDISPNFLYEKSIHSKNNSDIKKYIDQYNSKEIDFETRLASGSMFTFISQVDNRYKIITLYPIKNVITKKTVAYIVLQKYDNEIVELKALLFIVWLSLFFTIAFVLLAYYRIIEAQRIADKATKTKSLFLANMSHEIRTPMNSIIGFTDILMRGDLDEKQKKYIGHIKSSSANLLGIINDILDFSKVEAGKLNLENIPFNMKELGENLCSIFNEMAEDKGITLSYRYDSNYNGSVIGDPTRLNQMIINLVNNSIKFTNNGSVKLIVNTKEENEDKIQYQIIVNDTGIGMNEEVLKKLFDSFEQADSTTTRKYGGTGLGLSITSTLVELMGGEINVNSKVGEGSTFIITLEFKKYETDDTLQNKLDKENEVIDFSNLNVLVVEDNKTNQLLIDIILDEYGIEAKIANDGLEAIEILKENIFDLILMDIQMPNMNGYEATKIIRDVDSDVLEHNVEVVALSANATVDDVALSSEAGMNNHLAKPIDAKKLYEVLVKNLKKKENKNG